MPYIKVATVDDLPECPSARSIDVKGVPIALVRMEDGYYAVSDICTHAEASLCDGELVDGELICPLHYAAFNVRSGACTAPPASDDLRTYAVRVNGSDIEIDM